jgi:hypothetical protein
VIIDRPRAKIYQFPCMSAPKPSATEESGSTPVPLAVAIPETTKETPRSFLLAARRNLTEDDFDTPVSLLRKSRDSM